MTRHELCVQASLDPTSVEYSFSATGDIWYPIAFIGCDGVRVLMGLDTANPFGFVFRLTPTE